MLMIILSIASTLVDNLRKYRFALHSARVPVNDNDSSRWDIWFIILGVWLLAIIERGRIRSGDWP